MLEMLWILGKSDILMRQTLFEISICTCVVQSKYYDAKDVWEINSNIVRMETY